MSRMIKPGQVILLVLLVLSASCSNKEKINTQINEISSNNNLTEANTPESSEKTISDSTYKYFNNSNYIAFIKNDMFVSLFKFTGKTNFSEYQNEIPLYSNQKEDPIWFLDLVNDLLILDEGTSPSPHLIIAYDIRNEISILDKYLYKNYYNTNDNKITVLKEIGSTITQDDYNKIPKNIQNKIKQFISEDPQNENCLMYYYEYTFDVATKQIEPLNSVYVTTVW